MGNLGSKNIIFGTLNFSGICLSPFEYHDSTVDKEVMSVKFQQIMKRDMGDAMFLWDVGKIDQNFQKNRYTPIYNADIFVEKNKLVNREQFELNWKERYAQNKEPLQKLKEPPTQPQIDQTLQFDWICYETFINFVYASNQSSLFEISKIKELDPAPFVSFLKQWHSKPYLSNQKKIKKVMELISKIKIDVLCLQQAIVDEKNSKAIWQKAVGSDFQVIVKQKLTSVLILKKKSFPNKSSSDQKFQQQFSQKLNFGQDSVIAKRGNYLLISGHLSSKKQKYQPQGKQMFEQIQKLIQSDKNLNIIVGIDSNHFLNNNKNILYIVPSDETEFTTIKKRTAIQLQTKKVNVIVKQAKDQIISTQYIIKHSVSMITGTNASEKTYLPSEDHPFDHFLVYAEIQRESKQ